MYKDLKPIASFATSAFSAMVIYDFEYGINDYAISAYDYEGKLSGLRKRKIHYDNEGYSYINMYGARYYMNEFLSL